MSLMYKENNIGPKIEPCGTPEVNGNNDELPLGDETNWERHER